MKQTEHKEQCALVNNIRSRQRPDVFWCAIPNGGARTSVTGAMLKREGVRAGVPDLLFVVDGQAFFLEMKAKKGRMSNSQGEISAEIFAAGGIWRVAYGLDEALEILEQFGVIWPDRGRMDKYQGWKPKGVNDDTGNLRSASAAEKKRA